ncbi:hypothetical protein [Phytoactinopolyspora mesophila]|uniref:Uncharacterized protein n=1 Tax=Phytoactinopolyspora mesophila TaxID=2650750 RepID=A0A7K3M5L9_9ACTN|nr:hypothetical protein [Phytoactinopolyspora mesophila]NDL58614.1 hypothetical protein [Phytoactinopolyspora mesophila]
MYPRELPKLRDEVLDVYKKFQTMDEGHHGVVNLLKRADMYYVTETMSALAVQAGSELETEGFWDIKAQPSDNGFIFFDGGIGSLDYQFPGTLSRVDIPIHAICWGTSERLVGNPADTVGVELTYYTDGNHERSVSGNLYRDAFDRSTLRPILGDVFHPVDGPDSMHMTTVLKTLQAPWLLMSQPEIVERTQHKARRKVKGGASPRKRRNDVVLIDVRKKYRPTDENADTGTKFGRKYKHRWVVRGHWRNQPYGPGRKQHRRQWIASYVKGPDGAEVLRTEKVNVWRS